MDWSGPAAQAAIRLMDRVSSAQLPCETGRAIV